MYRYLIILVSSISLIGCTMGLGHRDPVEAKRSLNQALANDKNLKLDKLPPSVEADLMPDLNPNASLASDTIKRYNIKADGIDAKAFFTSLVKGTPYSIAIQPDVTGSITVNLTDVTLDEVFSVVRDIYGFDIEKSGNVIQVFPAGLRTVSIPVDYIQFKRSGRSLTSITTSTMTTSDSSSSSSSTSDSSSSTSTTSSNGGTEIETVSESDFWPQLKTAIENLIGVGKGQSVVIVPQASLVTVRAFPDAIRQVRNFLGVSQQRMHRQVILETKIIEVTLSDGYQQGINWSNLSLGDGKVVIQRVGASTLPGLDDIGDLLNGQTNITVSDGTFSGVLSFMQTQGDVNVLSSPRVTAANNQKAVIKVGTDEYYVTDVSSVVLNGTSTETTFDVELTPFFSGISLDVTPQIDQQGNVILHVHPAVIDVQDQTKQITYGSNTLTLPLAQSSVRESDSVIRAQDGDVVVIGGLMKSSVKNQVSKVPFLGDLPAIGHLFRNVSESTEKTELVILLKPTVVGVNTWKKELERSQGLLNDWFPEAK
ncbi:pilus (MSHA type) biogenesis protein MshL [Vibrio sp. S4M6]|uniref:pilus (MSHA type) biogenesis protein MshL n=1 Tax=Vibrio sinus TaxID=2946865 RepID=UPI00202A4BD2|nr:pilus (MSHA type) biogenesis protein MshL [Vibrio sinus]MCL9780524.1 pilus (MSHA type) biogenesis protein MshL [Vibrio sinus]